MMSEYELRRLARLIVQGLIDNDLFIAKVAKMMPERNRIHESEKRLVGAKEAAKMLGISVTLLRRIKDDENGIPQFSYVKGVSKSSPLKFNAATLMDEYERYVSGKQ